ncbi:cob(I)yrinic acid a,c-diamide adenosyltransferase [Patescibacteria group bacterium]
MLYTRKGDDGSTKTFGCCDQRISKSSAVAEALGTLDEVNSFLGVCKVEVSDVDWAIPGTDKKLVVIVDDVQQNLFTVQAEVAGAEKKINEEEVGEIEKVIDAIENELPPIKTFFVSGGTELAARFDFARTLARRAERRVTAVQEEGSVKVSTGTQSYLNRLSSLLYALARFSNHKAGVAEEKPHY